MQLFDADLGPISGSGGQAAFDNAVLDIVANRAGIQNYSSNLGTTEFNLTAAGQRTATTEGSGGGSGGQVNTVVGGTNATVDATDPVNPIINVPSLGVEALVAGTNITIDATDPANPIVSASGGGGGGPTITTGVWVPTWQNTGFGTPSGDIEYVIEDFGLSQNRVTLFIPAYSYTNSGQSITNMPASISPSFGTYIAGLALSEGTGDAPGAAFFDGPGVFSFVIAATASSSSAPPAYRALNTSQSINLSPTALVYWV
jgi:hypothetical protein